MQKISSTQNVIAKRASLNISRGLIGVIIHVYLTFQTSRAISQTGLHIKVNRKMAGLLNLSSILVMILLHQVSSQQCYVPGTCIGERLATIYDPVLDKYQCLSACNNLMQCTWFSSNEEAEYCDLFYTCDAISTALCPNCISGERSCPPTS